MNTERKQLDELKQFLKELHDDLEFEIFIAEESKDKPQIYLKKSTVPTLDTESIDKLNEQKFGVWFTPNSMKDGKRNKPNVTRFNAVPLDKDFTGSKEEITAAKADYLKMLLGLQLVPTVIVDTRNGFHLYWFLIEGSIVDIFTYESLQVLMQQKLDTVCGVRPIRFI